MIKVVYCNEAGKVEIAKGEFERLLEETYLRGVRENSEPSYNKGYRDGYRDGCSRTVATAINAACDAEQLNCASGIIDEVTCEDVDNATCDAGLFGLTYTNDINQCQ